MTSISCLGRSLFSLTDKIEHCRAQPVRMLDAESHFEYRLLFVMN